MAVANAAVASTAFGPAEMISASAGLAGLAIDTVVAGTITVFAGGTSIFGATITGTSILGTSIFGGSTFAKLGGGATSLFTAGGSSGVGGVTTSGGKLTAIGGA